MVTDKTIRVWELRYSMMEYFGFRCANPKCSCREYDLLQFAHIQKTELCGRSRGSYERIRDVIQHPECYILLCEDCHRLFDAGELFLPMMPVKVIA